MQPLIQYLDMRIVHLHATSPVDGGQPLKFKAILVSLRK
jgi:hypothetical protein